MKNRIASLMYRLAFPADSIEEIANAADKLYTSRELSSAFESIVKRYDETEFCDYMQMLEDMKALSQNAKIHEYTGAILLLLAMCDTLKKRYEERGISEEIYYGTVSDLKYKNEECRLLFDVSGTFVAPWFPGFFRLERFALGRLQFEIIKLGLDCECKGVKLTRDNNAINVHIPRTGTRLDHREVVASYDRAKEFFKDHFKDQPTVFACHSWLLYPWNESVLAPTSNLYAFYHDFTIVAQGDNEKHNDAWRLFDCVFDGDVQKLPRDSSLRRAYAERIESGLPTGWGMGVFIKS